MLLYRVTPRQSKADNSHVVEDVKGTYVKWGRKTLPSDYYTDTTILVITII